MYQGLLGHVLTRANNEAAAALEYYRSNYTVQFVDHLLSEFNGWFSDENQVGIKLLKTLPSYFHTQCEQGVMDLEEIKSELLFWESDLPHLALLMEWCQRWKNTRIGKSLLDSLKQCDADVLHISSDRLVYASPTSIFLHFLFATSNGVKYTIWFPPFLHHWILLVTRHMYKIFIFPLWINYPPNLAEKAMHC